jgi:hypothetical protein
MAQSECVAWSKKYNLERFGIQLWAFHWSAFSGWTYNTSFPLDKYDRVEYRSWMFPPPGATIFWWTEYNPIYWHTAIAHDGCTESKLCTVSQNTTGKSGDVIGDEIRLKDYDYRGVLWWYAHKDTPKEEKHQEWPKEYESDIKNVWKQNVAKNPHFKKHFTDYNDKKTCTIADCKCLIDIAINQSR